MSSVCTSEQAGQNPTASGYLFSGPLSCCCVTSVSTSADTPRSSTGNNPTRPHERHAVIVITHYQRLLDYLVPDFVHVLHDGRIVKSGTRELALELEKKGYGWVEEEMAAAR